VGSLRFVMEQKLNSQVFPANFPPELAAKAFVHSGEAAWRPPLAVEAVEWLGTHGYAVLGTEVFLLVGDGIQSLPYFQSVKRREDEDWNSFAPRSATETINYLTAFTEELAQYGDVCISVTWMSESGLRDVRAR